MGWTGRGGMFLAPAGNPSSLRFGHPDVATEHTGLSPIPSPLREGGVVGAGCVGEYTAGPRLGKSVRGGGKENTRVRYRRQLTGEQDRYLGAVVVPYGCLGTYLRARDERIPCSACERGAAIPSCSDIRVPELCEGGSPVGAKEVYSGPNAHLKASHHIWQAPLHERGVHPASHPKTLEGCSTHHTVVLT